MSGGKNVCYDLSINVIDRIPKKEWDDAIKGKIQIGEYVESFYMPLDYWSIKDYETQWEEGIKRLSTHDQSCLVTAINDPKQFPFIEWWILYKVDNKICLQNFIIPPDIYQEKIGNKLFTINSCYDFIPKRKTHSDEGDKISEWCIDE